MRSRGFGGLRGPAFVEIDEVRHCENVVAISDAVLFFPLFQSRRERIAPSEFRSESIPDKKVALVQAPPVFKTPFENLFISSALENALAKIGIVDTQKIAAGTIKRSGRPEVVVIILVQLAAGILSNFVQHTREIHHAARHFLRAFWISHHVQINAASAAMQFWPGYLQRTDRKSSSHPDSLNKPKTAKHHN